MSHDSHRESELKCCCQASRSQFLLTFMVIPHYAEVRGLVERKDDVTWPKTHMIYTANNIKKRN